MSTSTGASGKRQDEQSKQLYIRDMYWLCFILLLVVWGAWHIFAFAAETSEGAAIDFGQRGDAFGSLNTLFTGMAFLAIVWQIILQSSELKIQQASLKEQSKATSTIALQAQSDARTKQAVIAISLYRELWQQGQMAYSAIRHTIHAYEATKSTAPIRDATTQLNNFFAIMNKLSGSDIGSTVTDVAPYWHQAMNNRDKELLEACRTHIEGICDEARQRLHKFVPDLGATSCEISAAMQLKRPRAPGSSGT